MTGLTWEDGVVFTEKYHGKFRIVYQTSAEEGAWRLYFESYKGKKITYELFEGDMDEVTNKGMSLFNGVEAEATTLEDVNGKAVI